MSKPDWSLAPKIATHLAQDKLGDWRFFTGKPIQGYSTWLGLYISPSYQGSQTKYWKETLEERPSEVAAQLQEVPPQLQATGVKFDTGKRQWGLLPWDALKIVVDALMFGAKKYSPGNWRLVDNAEERYKEAAMRHLVAVFEGEWIDLESGLPHLACLICCALFVLSLHKD